MCSSDLVAPVRVGQCVFGVWAQDAADQAGMACDGADPEGPNSFELTPAAELVFRTNRNQLVLNDVRTGAVWSMNAAQPVQIADWQAIKPQQPKDSQDDEKKTDSEQVRQAPQAQKIIDIAIEGISMAVTQRDEFSSVIQRGGGRVEALLASLREKISQR